MKLLKKTIAIILVSLIFAGIFTACGKEENGAEPTSAPATQEVTRNPEFLEATDEDFEKLNDLIERMYLSRRFELKNSDGNIYYYDKSDENALAIAMYMLYGGDGSVINGDSSVTDERYVDMEFFLNYVSDDSENAYEPDPLNKISGYSYVKMNADDVDWIIRNIFALEPDRTKTDEDFDIDSLFDDQGLRAMFNYYYYDGYYYYAATPTGGGFDGLKIVEHKVAADGSYIVNLQHNEPAFDETVFKVEAALKNVDGERVWAVSYFGTEPVDKPILEAEEEDFELLCKTVRGIWLSSPAFGEYSEYFENGKNVDEFVVYYDVSSENALADAMYMLQNDGVCMYPDILPETTEPEGTAADSIWYYGDAKDKYDIPADPLNKFEIEPGKGYCMINAVKFDWALINVFGVTPDRTKTDDDFETDYPNQFDYYYWDGSYYFAVSEGGGGGMMPTVVDCVKNDDGSYTVKYSTYEEQYEHPDFYCDNSYYTVMEANAVLKEVNGYRVWCVNYVKDVDVILYEVKN